MKSSASLPYKLAPDLVLIEGAIPLTWWTVTKNFGDLLSPYLFEKLTGKPVNLVQLGSPGDLEFINEFYKIPNQKLTEFLGYPINW